jgi:hypothetical protein
MTVNRYTRNLAKEVAEQRRQILAVRQDLHTMKWVTLPQLIPHFVNWFSAHFRPEGESHKMPLFFGIAYTTNNRHDELVKIVRFYEDGTLIIRPIREDEMGKDIGYEKGIEQ